MSITVTPHLNFRGRARAALDFYASVFGGEVVAITYTDANAVADPSDADGVMWGQVETADGFRIMAYDVQAGKDYDQGVNSTYTSVRGTDPEAVQRYWDGLSEGADVQVPLGPSAWSPLYGMLQDRFGVVWVVDVAATA